MILGWSILLVSVAGCAKAPSTPADEHSGATASPSVIAFTDVTKPAGLSRFRHLTGAVGNKWLPETMGSGCGFVDYNGDGWMDIVLVRGGTWAEHGKKAALWLYQNNRDGTFTLQTKSAGLSKPSAYGFGVGVADYDNDGDQDIYLSTLHKNLLFRNDAGTYVEVAQQANVAGKNTWSSSVIFFDANKDGWLDLYVGNYVDWSTEKDIFCSVDGKKKAYCTPKEYEGVPGRFYQNNGDGTFTDRTEAVGLAHSPGKTLGIAALDYNEDGWTDLVLANDTERNVLYENDGDGTFHENGIMSGIAFGENGQARAGMGVDVGDVNNSGEPTIFVGNFSREMIGVYRYLGDGLFSDRAAASRLGQPSLRTLTFGLFLFDVDLDQDLDVFAANGHVQEDAGKVRDGISYRQPSQLFINGGAGAFEPFNPGSSQKALSQRMVARGAAYADYDHDGDLDVLVVESNGPAHLLRNDLKGPGHHFLRVAVTGASSNRDAVGTRLTAVVGSTRMTRYVRAGGSYLSESEKTVTFGLGKAVQVDTLTARWPSGRMARFNTLKSGQFVHLREGKGVVKKTSLTGPHAKTVTAQARTGSPSRKRGAAL